MKCVINAVYSDADSKDIWVYSLHYILYYTLQAYGTFIYKEDINFFGAINTLFFSQLYWDIIGI